MALDNANIRRILPYLTGLGGLMSIYTAFQGGFGPQGPLLFGLFGTMLFTVSFLFRLKNFPQVYAWMLVGTTTLLELSRLAWGPGSLAPRDLETLVIPIFALTSFWLLGGRTALLVVFPVAFLHVLADWLGFFRSGSPDHTRALMLFSQQFMQAVVCVLAWAVGELGKKYGRVLGEREALTRLAYEDMLTRLPNRRRAYDLLLSLQGERYAVLLADVDGFKSVNDRYGHPVGDAVLEQVAALLDRDLPPGGLAARWGGEEFILILPQHADALAHAERVRRRVAKHPLDSGLPHLPALNVTVSVGVAHAHPTDNPQNVLSLADHALYDAKTGGRNRVTHSPVCCHETLQDAPAGAD